MKSVSHGLTQMDAPLEIDVRPLAHRPFNATSLSATRRSLSQDLRGLLDQHPAKIAGLVFILGAGFGIFQTVLWNLIRRAPHEE